MRDREQVDDAAELDADGRLVCELLGVYIERRVRGEPHGGIALLRAARVAGAHVEQRLAVLISYYDAHRAG